MLRPPRHDSPEEWAAENRRLTKLAAKDFIRSVISFALVLIFGWIDWLDQIDSRITISAMLLAMATTVYFAFRGAEFDRQADGAKQAGERAMSNWRPETTNYHTRRGLAAPPWEKVLEATQDKVIERDRERQGRK